MKTKGEEEHLMRSVGSSALSIDFLSWVQHLQSSLFLVSLENVTLGSCGALFFDSGVFQSWDASFPKSDLTLTGSFSFESKNKDNHILLLFIKVCMIMLKPEKNSDETLIILSIRKSTEILENKSFYVLIISCTLWKGSLFTWGKAMFRLLY